MKAEEEVLDLLKEQKTAFTKFKTQNDEKVAGLEKKIESFEIKANRPPAPGDPDNIKKTGTFIIDDKGREIPVIESKQRLSDLQEFKREDDEPELNLSRMIKGIVTGNWKGAEYEMKAMSESPGSAGGFLAPASISSEIIDLARAKSVCIQAGARTLLMDTAEMTIVKLTGDPTSYWTAENAAITESDATFEPINLKALALACLVRVSIELLEDATMFRNTIENAIAKSLGLELDRVGLLGTGSGEPRGISNTPDINERSLGTNGGSLEFADISNAVYDIKAENGEPTAIIYSPRTWKIIDQWQDGVGNPLLQPESFKNLKKFDTTKISDTMTQGTSSTASMSIVADFTQLLFGLRKNITLEASRTGGSDTFEKMQVFIRAYLRADVGVLRPTHFTKLVGITG